MPWLHRLRKAEKHVERSTADPAAKVAVLAEQQSEIARQLRMVVEQLRRERETRV